MRIKEISASNFRTLEDFKLDFLNNYCTLSGQNNAGKTSVVQIIEHFLQGSDDPRIFGPSDNAISFAKHKTQWSSCDFMEISIKLEISRVDDSEVFFVVEKFSPVEIEKDTAVVRLRQRYTSQDLVELSCRVNGNDVDTQTASEILKKFRSAPNLVVHNSTHPTRNFFFGTEGYLEVTEAQLSPDERKKISDAEKTLHSRVRQAAKQHKDALSELLGKLSDRYQVELTSIDRGMSQTIPLSIKLTDKRVEVPLADWGSGTQNRTRVLMSVLDAVRARASTGAADRTTPVVIVEEPESFLHPSAQAEFGRILSEIANELSIQIIATTHSPYMLNQVEPSANILLNRKQFRKLPRETEIRETSGENWMLPFAEILGILPKEFEAWLPAFETKTTSVVLVEGEIDKEYFLFLREKYPSICQINEGVEFVPYGGKDALKNTPLLQFMINRFDSVFITYDLDADNDVKPNLERIGLHENANFCAVGLKGAGNGCVEGLVPEALKSSVYAENAELVTALASSDTRARKSAKSAIKRKILEKFKSSDVDEKDLSEFKKLFRKVGKAFL